MTDRVRTTALSLAWTLAACHRGGPATTEPPPQPPGPIAELQAGGDLLPIIVVPQSMTIETDDWTFEPGGQRLGSTEMGYCSVWDIPSGRLIRSFEADAGPCEEWAPAVSFDAFTLDDTSADETLTVDATSKGVAILDAKTGSKLRDLHCPDCDTVDDVTWSTQGHQLALVWQDTARIEIWDADAGTLVRAASIPIAGELEELELGWTQAGATVAWTQLGFAVECDQYESYYDGECEWDEAEQVGTRRSIEQRLFAVGPAGPTEIDAVNSADSDAYLAFDPEFRWVFWSEEYSERRAGTTTTLYFEGLDQLDSAMGWELMDDFDDYGESLDRTGYWHTDGATHWAVTITHQDYDGSESMIEWETTLASPALGRRAGVITESLDYDSVAEIELFGFAKGAVRFAGEVCSENCTTLGRPLPPDCLLLDAASGHGAELLDCEGDTFLRNTGAAVKLPVDATEMLQWWWSRGGSLALHDGGKFTVLEAGTGSGMQPRADVIDVFDARLGPELERLVLVTANGIELIELTRGEVILSLPGAKPDDVAISPNADRLALLEAGEIRVLALPSGTPITSWATKTTELAFRQDGKAIFVGDERPELAFDASTGKPIADPSLARITAAIDEGGEIDPSWRWIMNDERGALMRTLDARVLAFRDDTAWLPDTGQYIGTGPGPEFAFRVGTDAWAVPEFDAGDLRKWLERADLVELFATGQPIAAPRMSAGELAAVRAKIQAPTPKPVN